MNNYSEKQRWRYKTTNIISNRIHLSFRSPFCSIVNLKKIPIQRLDISTRVLNYINKHDLDLIIMDNKYCLFYRPKVATLEGGLLKRNDTKNKLYIKINDKDIYKSFSEFVCHAVYDKGLDLVFKDVYKNISKDEYNAKFRKYMDKITPPRFKDLDVSLIDAFLYSTECFDKVMDELEENDKVKTSRYNLGGI